VPFISLTEADAAAMLGELGLKDLDALFAHIPADLRGHAFALPPGRTQLEVERELEDLAARNQRAAEGVCFLGAGVYDHHVPAALREILRRGELYTAYTPYQPEIAQGMLQALFEYQTMVARLTAWMSPTRRFTTARPRAWRRSASRSGTRTGRASSSTPT